MHKDPIKRKEYKRKYYLKNKENINSKCKKYYNCNKEKVAEINKQWRSNNVEALKESKKKYYESNKDKILFKVREWRKNNPDKKKAQSKKWKSNNRIKVNAHAHASWNKLRDHSCSNCKSTDKLEFHHTNYNLRQGFTLCKICHTQEHNKLRTGIIAPEITGE